MDFALIGKALILGIVEGVTEFLPVSSTGHLIVVGSLLNFGGAGAKAFLVVIQFGAILAVCWEYRRRIGRVAAGMWTDATQRRFALNVVIATIPAVVLGLSFEKVIKEALFSPVPVAVALVVGGLVILWAQARERRRGSAPARVQALDELGPLDALKVGCAQCCALIPGVSRSGSTIIGAMLLGVDRRVATEFSFFSSNSRHRRRDALRIGEAPRRRFRRYGRCLHRRYGRSVRQRVRLRALAAALPRHSRFHGLRLVPDRVRHGRARRRLWRRAQLGGRKGEDAHSA